MFLPYGFYNSNMLYTIVEMQRKALEPVRFAAHASKEFYRSFFPYTRIGRSMAAGSEMLERFTRRYEKPEFGITETIIGKEKVKIQQVTVSKKTFCHLLHFKKPEGYKQPKILVVAPMSGHFATLLRGTVEGLLPHFDVYITDWVHVRDIPVEEGEFHFDTYVQYVMEYCRNLGPKLSVLAVCQPSVPVMVAAALMSQQKDEMVPANIILMGGPIDTRKNPTEVNDYAADRTIRWFKDNVITQVPSQYKGAGRLVYPGFMQLWGFLAMNMQNHVEAHWELFKHLVEGDGESVASHKKFYNEYLAVMDLPAEFYLDTVNIVFKEHLLPRGKLVCNGIPVNLESITKPALLCIEGEKDDISGRGQTKAAIALCSGIPEYRKQYHLQMGVGHYGIFNGRRYREQVVPLMVDFVFKHKQEVYTMTKAKAKKAPAKKKVAKKKVAKKKVAKKKTAKRK